MTKLDSLRRLLLPCFSYPSSHATVTSSPTTTTTTKKRLSASLRDDLPDDPPTTNQNQPYLDSQDDDDDRTSIQHPVAPPRPSKTMVVGTIFGSRTRGRSSEKSHVFFCVQHDRLSTKPILLLELSIPTHQLVKEMRFGLVRVALESDRPEFRTIPLRSVPVWIVYLNGKKVGFALRRKASQKNRLMLKTMQNTTVGAGVIPSSRFGSSGPGSDHKEGKAEDGEEEEEEEEGEIMYMRANYEHVVGGADVESFHLINPEVQGPGSGQELSVFLMRSSR